MPVKTKKPVKPKLRKASREEIRRAAVTLFAEKGLEGTTVREIADRAGVNLCLISYYFGGKEGLYRECIEEYGKLRLSIAQEMVGHAETPAEFRRTLTKLVENMLESYAANAELSRVLSREIERDLPVSRDVFENTFLLAMRGLVDFVQQGQKRGYVKKSLDARMVAMLIQSMVVNLVRSNVVVKRYFSVSIFAAEDRARFAKTILETILFGMMEAKHV